MLECPLQRFFLHYGRIPGKWQRILLTVIPQGKRDQREPSLCEGIAGKIYHKVSTIFFKRSFAFLKVLGMIPAERHGFRERKSAMFICQDDTHRKRKERQTVYLYRIRRFQSDVRHRTEELAFVQTRQGRGSV